MIPAGGFAGRIAPEPTVADRGGPTIAGALAISERCEWRAEKTKPRRARLRGGGLPGPSGFQIQTEEVRYCTPLISKWDASLEISRIPQDSISTVGATRVRARLTRVGCRNGALGAASEGKMQLLTGDAPTNLVHGVAS
jgi:hypothetical protein